MKLSHILFWVLLPTLVLLSACSTQKNTTLTRSYHNLTSFYNIYFNGNESLKQGLIKLDNSYIDDYTRILPVVKYTDASSAASVTPDMDRAIEKTAKVIKNHSITVKPKRKKKRGGLGFLGDWQNTRKKDFMSKTDYNNTIDDCYLLMGRANFYKQDYSSAIKSLERVLQGFDYEESKYDAMLYLARTYIEKNDYANARKYLTMVESDNNHPEKLDRQIVVIYAHMYVKEKNYKEAIPYLQKAIEKNKKKKLRARYTFILAQIYQKEEDYGKATLMYDKVIKMNPPYEMVFNAQINMANSFKSGNSSALRKQLEKMLKDDKNLDYRDQIYYALAQIYEQGNDVPQAMENYKKSVQYSVTNQNQKALSHLAIADIYFSRPDYENAQAYYDSAMQVLSPTYPDYDIISRKTKNLSELVGNLKVVQREDSLQRIANMDENARNQFVNKLITDIKAEEAAQKQREQQAIADRMTYMNDNNTNQAQNSFIFYNPSALAVAQSDFKRIWGDRKLEDNWRRSNKSVSMNLDGSVGDAQQLDDTLDKYQPEFYLRNLPVSDSAMTVSHQRIAEALFKVGEVYRIKFADYPEAIIVFENLNTRYPDHDKQLAAYYYLYAMNTETGNTAMATIYKNLIINKYPNSKYAMFFSNPNYLDELEKNKQNIEDAYLQAYNAFQQNSYSDVISYCKNAEQQYPGNDVMPNFLFLQALAQAGINNTVEMNTLLNRVIAEYPESAQKEAAIEMLTKVQAKQAADEQIKKDKADADRLYAYDAASVHFFVIVLHDVNADVSRLKFNIYNFNIDNYQGNSAMEVAAEEWDNDMVIYVKGLENQFTAEAYAKAVMNNVGVKSNLQANYSKLIISKTNFAALQTDKRLAVYNLFAAPYYK